MNRHSKANCRIISNNTQPSGAPDMQPPQARETCQKPSPLDKPALNFRHPRYRPQSLYFPGSPLDFIAELSALVPKPRVNLTRFHHGVFAPNSKYRVDVTLAKRSKGRIHKENEDKTPERRYKAMTWAQRLKRVFNLHLSVCPKCGGDANAFDRFGSIAVTRSTVPERPVRIATKDHPGWLNFLS